MTNSSGNNGNSRLDRIEKIVEANALAIEGLRVAQEADRLQLRSSIADLVAMLAQQSEEAARESAELKRRQEESDQRFETVLAELRADRAEMREANERNHQEHEEFRQAIRALIERGRQ